MLQKCRIRASASKMSLCQEEVSFLGHVVSAKGDATDPSKSQRVSNWPIPTNQKEVQQFLGLTGYYRRFVKNFAHIPKPLYYLTEKKVKFQWTEDCQKAFTSLKNKLTSPPVLIFPDHSRPFILDTDASDLGIGAVLSQIDNDGQEK